jgi:hypothetical protein
VSERTARCFILALVALSACSRPKRAPVEQAETEALAAASQIGALLYQYDLASMMAMDSLNAGEPMPSGMSGILATGLNENWRVELVDREARVAGRFDVELKAGAQKATRVELSDRPPLAAEQALAFAAIQTAINAGMPACGRLHPTVLPAGTDGWSVYLLALPELSEERILGGHSRILVSRDGKTVLRKIPLDNGCLRLVPDASWAAGLQLDNTVGDFPNESHVFESLAYGQSLFVKTKSGVWLVEGTKLTRVANK